MSKELKPVEVDMYLDFQAIKDAHRIEDIAVQLGLPLKKNGAQLRGPCPSGQGGERAFVITPAKQAFYSFGANKGGDVLSMVAFVRNCTLKEAAAYLSDADVPEKKRRAEPAEKSPAAKPSEGFAPLEYLQHDHEAVSALGFDIEDAKRIGCGYAPRGVMRGYVALPVRDCNGRLLGYVGIQEAKLPTPWRFDN